MWRVRRDGHSGNGYCASQGRTASQSRPDDARTVLHGRPVMPSRVAWGRTYPGPNPADRGHGAEQPVQSSRRLHDLKLSGRLVASLRDQSRGASYCPDFTLAISEHLSGTRGRHAEQPDLRISVNERGARRRPGGDVCLWPCANQQPAWGCCASDRRCSCSPRGHTCSSATAAGPRLDTNSGSAKLSPHGCSLFAALATLITVRADPDAFRDAGQGANRG